MEIAAIIKSSFTRPKVRFTGLVLLVTTVSACVLFSRVQHTRFHGDESGWISAGRYYTGLLWQGDFEWEKWECEPCDGWGGAMNMQLGKWLIGIPLEFDAQARSQAFTRYYEFDAPLEENLQQGRVPPQETLICARRASAVSGVICCVLIFAIGYCTYNAFVGVLSTALLLCHSLFVEHATRAMTDVHYNLFLLCLCLAVIFFVRAATKRTALTRSALCGIFAGLACAIKCTGIIIGTGLFVVALATQQFWFVKRSLKEILALLALFGLSALVVIYGLNPYFWPSLPALRDRSAIQEFKSYAAEMAQTKSLPRQVRERYPHFGTITRLLEFPSQFRRWNNFMTWAGQKRPNDRIQSSDRILIVSRQLFVRHLLPGGVVLLIAGIFFILRKREPKISGFTDPARLVLLQWFLVNYLFIGTFMKVNWGRYYLPTVVSAIPLAAIGIYGTGLWINRRLLRRMKRLTA